MELSLEKKMNLTEMHDLKYLTIRKNSSYLKSLYIGVIGATFTLPFAIWNMSIFPAVVRLIRIFCGYFKFVLYGILGYADTMTEDERMSREMNAKIKILKENQEQIIKFLDAVEKDEAEDLNQ